MTAGVRQPRIEHTDAFRRRTTESADEITTAALVILHIEHDLTA
ncbi:hypothetical protein [Kibdelosporangium aridum]|nr:hypothetical protein [Kibdelosporangium aridum]